MAFGKLAFGGEEFRYDTLPGLGSRFAIGDRGIADLAPVTVDSTVGDTRNAGTPAPAAAVQETAAAESKVTLLADLLTHLLAIRANVSNLAASDRSSCRTTDQHNVFSYSRGAIHLPA